MTPSAMERRSMYTHYQDITDRIPEPPKWWDEAGVPRYCEFHPSKVANIYASEVAFCLIECQRCQRQFKVAISNDQNDETIAEGIRKELLSYGDPPNVRCCPPGATMMSEMVAVLEYWERRDLTPEDMFKGKDEWRRNPTWKKLFKRSGQ